MENKFDHRPIIEQWVADRQRARTDFMFLFREVLQYQDIEDEVHGPVIERLQKFQGGEDILDEKIGLWIDYKPACNIWELKGPRSRLFLDPRGHLKTTIITIGHSIAWVINYPDIRILQSMATGDQVQKVIQETLYHFRFNNKFRALFPELCPRARSAKDFGNNEGFVVPCRKRKWLKEPTVSTCSVGKVVAGGHYEVLKNSDLVDKENVKTPNQIQEVIQHFRYLNPLLERGPIWPHRGWVDVEGTRYDFADLYGAIIEADEKRPEEKKRWQIHVRSAEVDPEKKKTLWERRFPWDELKSIEEDDPYVYSTQYKNHPIPVGSALAVREDIQFVSRKIMKQVCRSYHMTVDLAGMEANEKNDFTVMVVAGFDNDGRMNVLDVQCKRFQVFEVIDVLYLLCGIFPGILDIKIEKEAHSRVLLPFLKREQEKRGKYLPPIIEIRRDNRTAKKQRIKGLQSFFKAGIVRFAEEISAPTKAEIFNQILRFSDASTYHDDILDALADQMQNRDGGAISDLMPRGKGWDGKPIAFPEDKFLGFDLITKEPLWTGQLGGANYYDSHTGL